MCYKVYLPLIAGTLMALAVSMRPAAASSARAVAATTGAPATF